MSRLLFMKQEPSTSYFSRTLYHSRTLLFVTVTPTLSSHSSQSFQSTVSFFCTLISRHHHLYSLLTTRSVKSLLCFPELLNDHVRSLYSVSTEPPTVEATHSFITTTPPPTVSFRLPISTHSSQNSVNHTRPL